MFYSCVEENGLLTDITNLLAVVAQVQALQVFAINEDLAFGRVVEALNKLHNSGLAGAGRSNDCSCLTHLERDVEVVHNFLIRT